MLRAIQISHRARNQIQTCKRLFSTTNPEKGVAEEPSPDDKDKQIAMLQDSYRRAIAETENIRQRTRKEIDQAKSFSISKFAADLLGSIDVLTLALNSVPTQPELSKDLKDLHVGVSMTKIELLKALKRHGVEPFDPTGSAFDPNMHQAMFHVPHPGKEPGSILETTLLGYTLNGRVLRPAQVGVVKDVKSEGEKV